MSSKKEEKAKKILLKEAYDDLLQEKWHKAKIVMNQCSVPYSYDEFLDSIINKNNKD